MSSKHSRNVASGLARGSFGLAGLLAMAMSTHAQALSVIDDYEAASNQNKFLGYTYFYNDAADGGTTTIASSAPGATKTELLFDPVKSVDVGANGSTHSLKLDFTYGATKPISAGCACAYGQMAGVGTQLAPGTDTKGTVLDMTGATTLSFWAKSSVAMTIRVEVTTKAVTDFGYYRTQFPITPTWTRYEVGLTDGLGGLTRPTWATAVIPFDIKTTQKLQFSVSADDNLTLTAGTLWLDSIVANGYNWVPPTACMTCVGAVGAGTGLLLSDLEPPATAGGRAANQNAAGGFWYAYNDAAGRTVTTQSEYSEIFEGISTAAGADPLTPLLVIGAGKGANASQGAYIKATLGPSFPQNGSTIMPFVGIGTRVSDQLGTAFMDATTSTGMSFDYWTDAAATFKFIRLEVKANQDLGTNKGVVHNVLLPATAGVWKSATVPWDKLTLPDWTDAPPLASNPLKKSALEKFQWAIQDAPGTTGALAIDNVKMIGMTAFQVGILNHASKSVKGLRTSQVGGALQVSYVLPAGVDAVQLRLIDMKGSVAASRTLAGKGLLTATLGTQGLRSGLYTVQVRHGNVNESAPITLLK